MFKIVDSQTIIRFEKVCYGSLSTFYPDAKLGLTLSYVKVTNASQLMGLNSKNCQKKLLVLRTRNFAEAVFLVKLPGNKILIQMSSLLRPIQLFIITYQLLIIKLSHRIRPG
jgi:hypothetical protein